MKRQKKINFSGSWQMCLNIFFHVKGRGSKFYVDRNTSICIIWCYTV